MTKKKNTFFQSNAFFLLLFTIATIGVILPIYFRDQLLELTSFGLIGLFLINFLGSATIFFPAPVILSVGIAGNLYNPLLVALVASLGSALGEGTGYLFGYSSREIMRLRSKKLTNHMIHFLFEKYGWIGVILFSLVPNPVIDGVGILAGLAGFSLWRFVLFVFIGRLVRNIVVAQLGASL